MNDIVIFFIALRYIRYAKQCAAKNDMLGAKQNYLKAIQGYKQAGLAKHVRAAHKEMSKTISALLAKEVSAASDSAQLK